RRREARLGGGLKAVLFEVDAPAVPVRALEADRVATRGTAAADSPDGHLLYSTREVVGDGSALRCRQTRRLGLHAAFIQRALDGLDGERPERTARCRTPDGMLMTHGAVLGIQRLAALGSRRLRHGQG